MTTLKAVLLTGLVSLPLGFSLAMVLLTQHNNRDDVQTTAAIPKMAVSADNSSITTIAAPQQGNDVALLKKDVQTLRMEVAAMKEEWRQSNKTRSVTERVPPNKNNPAREEALLAEEEKYFSQQGEALETSFRQQTIAPEWSKDADGLVRKGLASDKISAEGIISLECRSSICRLELANNRDSEVPDFVRFPQQIASELPNIINSQTESSENTTVFYLSKDELVAPN